ncbi:MAG TPA: hypothetical protein VGK73_31530 [Polyangiaceae bacterium]
MTTSNIYWRTLATFGAVHNLDKTIEECAELISEVVREKHGRSDLDKLANEAADVWICLEILRCHMGPEFDRALDAKLNRLAKRIAEKESAHAST